MQKHGVKTLNRDRDSLKEEQNLSVISHLKYERFCDLGLSESPMLKSWMDLGFQLTPAETHTVLWDRRIWLSFCLLPDQLQVRGLTCL